MSARTKRILRLRDLAEKQEKAARMEMAKAETTLRSAKAAKSSMLQRTFATLDTSVPPRLGHALIAASVSSAARQDLAITELDGQVQEAKGTWSRSRQHAGSVGKLYDRVEAKEREQAARVVERELGDMISGRIAMRNASMVSSGVRQSGYGIEGGLL